MMLWWTAAVLQISGDMPASLKLRANFDELSSGEPRVLVNVDHLVASVLARHGGLATALLAVLEVAVGAAALHGLRGKRVVVGSVLALLGVMW